MNRTQALFKIFEKYLRIRTDEGWLDFLRVENTSTVSRYRSGKRPLPENRIQDICIAAGISRKDFDKPIIELAQQLNVTESLPSEVLLSEGGGLVEDVRFIDELHKDLTIIFPGKDPDDGDKTKIWLDSFLIDKKISDKSRKIFQSSNTVLKSEFEGHIECNRGIVSIRINYPGLHFPSSSYLFEPLFKNSKTTIFSGIYLDVNGGMKDRIFATQCCMVNFHSRESFGDSLCETDSLFSRWSYVLDNKISRRGKLLCKSDPDDIEYIKNLALETFKI